jgi:dihydrofolate reductase
MKISLIAAMSKNRVIGKNNDLPWRLPDDMKYFQKTTKGHVVIMGRKNFDSLPANFKPLPNRTNVILTRNKDLVVEGCEIFTELTEAINFAKDCKEEELFIIGGGEVYKQSLHLADRIYLTRINHEIEGDTYFPKLTPEWKVIEEIHHPNDNRHQYNFDFLIFEK